MRPQQHIPWWVQLAARATAERTGHELWDFRPSEQTQIILAALDAGRDEKKIQDAAGDKASAIVKGDWRKKRWIK